MKKLIITAAALLLCGCSAASSDNSSNAGSAAEENVSHTAAEIFDMLSQSGKADQLDERADFASEQFEGACEKLYGVSKDSLTDGGIMFAGSGQISDEVSILRGADTSVLKKRAETRAKDFEGYAPAESQKAADAVVFEYGDFSVLIIADNADELKQLITDF